MKVGLKKLGIEKYITNSKGDVEYVVIPILKYERIVELLENFGLGLAIKEAEKDKIYTKEDALKLLEND